MTKNKSKIVVERNDYLLGIEVYSILKNNLCTLEQITKKIYGNTASKNVVRVYQCTMVLLKHGLVLPVVRNGALYFKFNEKTENEL